MGDHHDNNNHWRTMNSSTTFSTPERAGAQPPPSVAQGDHPHQRSPDHQQQQHHYPHHPAHPHSARGQAEAARGAAGRSNHTTPPRAIAARTPTSIHQDSGVPHGHVPAYLPGSASLVEELDQRILIVLRDGKHLIGTLSSFDQFSNLVLQGALERKVLPMTTEGMTYYVDIPLGIYIVRGDSIVLMGKLREEGDPALEGPSPMTMKQVSLDEWARLTTSRRVDDETLQWDFDTDLTA